MVANSGMKQKFETILEVIRGLVLDFLFNCNYLSVRLYEKYPLHITSAKSTTLDTLYII